MKHRPVLRIATRASKLATIQALAVGDALKQAFPDIDIKYIATSTAGDQSALTGNLPPTHKDDFVREIETLVFEDSADLAIHSMKDVPTMIPEGLTVQSILKRGDPRDVLIGTDSLFYLSPNARIGTSSPRRTALLKFRAKFNNILSIRGNVDTRLSKLASGEYDAIILAAAGLHRLQLHQKIGAYLDPAYFIPAACQGTLAVEFRSDDTYIASMVAHLQDSTVEAATRCERAIVRELQADCGAALGVYCEDRGPELCLHAIVLDPNGTEALELQLSGLDASQLAAEGTSSLLSMGAEKLLRP